MATTTIQRPLPDIIIDKDTLDERLAPILAEAASQIVIALWSGISPSQITIRRTRLWSAMTRAVYDTIVHGNWTCDRR